MSTSRDGVGIAGAVVAGAIAFAGYLGTLAPGLTWAHEGADGGDLAAAVAVLGVPHPPGYPAYVMAGRLFALLPVGDVAFRLNLMSATCAALAVAGLYLLLLQMRPQGDRGATWLAHIIALATALAFAFSPVFWSQAVIAEVYALNALFAVALLWLSYRTRSALALGLLLGLGLGNHLSLILLLPALLLPALALSGRRALSRTLLRGGAGLLCGLLVYAYLPLRAAQQPFVNWGQADTLDGFLWMVGAEPYRHYLFGLPLAELPARLSAWAVLLVEQLSWPGVALMLLGVWDLLGEESGQNTRSRRVRLAGWGQVLAVMLYSVYALGYRTPDSYMYLIPAYMVAFLWLGRGLFVVAQGALAWTGGRQGVAWTRPMSAALAAVCALAACGQWAVHRPAVDLSEDRTAQRYTEQVFALIPSGALVITGSDEHTFSLWYHQATQGQRDVLVLDRDLTQFDWYCRQIERLEPALVGIVWDEPAANVAAAIERVRGKRAVFLADEDATLLERFRWQKEGELYRLR